MPCPFGYVAEEEELSEGEEVEVVDETKKAAGTGSEAHPPDAHGVDQNAGAAKMEPAPKGKSKSKAKNPLLEEDPNDPLAWFYANQIKSEQDFQAKKENLRAEARKRLDQIMDKKQQRLLWPSDSEFDDLSISSGELSDLDSDVHSLASVRSCTYSWIASARYTLRAEAVYKWLSFASLAISGCAMYAAWGAMSSTKQAGGLLNNQEWLTGAFLVALLMSGMSASGLLATHWRSKRVLLFAQLLAMLSLGLAVFIATAVSLKPTRVERTLQQALCGKFSDLRGVGVAEQRLPSRHVPLCDKLPSIKAGVAAAVWNVKWCSVGVALGAMTLACIGMWYMLELCFVEKKGAKHTRRHRRKCFSIPWEKIKLEGPPLPCGAGGAGAAHPHVGRGTGTGKCPFFSHSSVAAKDKCV